MTQNSSISRAYSIEDTSRFMIEALDSYKQMLRKDIRSRRSRRENHSEERRLQSQKLELAFQDWLEDVFYEESSSRAASDMKILSNDAERKSRQGIPSPSTSVMTNYGGSRFSFCSSIEQYPEYELHQDNDIFYENCSSKCFSHLNPLEYENSDKSRAGSWSDSGYCCDRSDSDNSRFSSLSFRECFDTDEYECSNQELEELPHGFEEEYLDNGRYMKNSNRDHIDNSTGLEMPEMECYNTEELKILFELMNNPENFHETTKELSDMARDVKSKRQHSKTFSNIGRFFRNIVKNIRKCSENRNKLKAEMKEIKRKDGSRNKHQRSPSLHSHPSPFQKRSSSVELARKFGFPVKNIERKTIKRASSYSSLFGRKGSLFSHTEQYQNFHMGKRSESCDIIRQITFEDIAENVSFDDVERNRFDLETAYIAAENSQGLQPVTAYDISSEDDCCRNAQLGIIGNDRYKRSQGQSVERELVAPLTINVNEKRSAYTRKIRKLKDNVFDSEKQVV